MNWPEHDSPFWPILRLAVIGAILIVCMSILYEHGFDFAKDGTTLIAILSGLGIVERLQWTKGQKPDPPETKP